jgi:hypothetical protein
VAVVGVRGYAIVTPPGGGGGGGGGTLVQEVITASGQWNAPAAIVDNQVWLQGMPGAGGGAGGGGGGGGLVGGGGGGRGGTSGGSCQLREVGPITVTPSTAYDVTIGAGGAGGNGGAG